MELITKIAMWLYMYCTDFVINLANITGTSYYEVNAFIFVILWPIVTVVLSIYYIYLRVQIRVKRQSH